MSDQWLIIAFLMTPVAILSMILINRDERLLKIIDLCVDRIQRLILKPLSQRLFEPLNRKAQERMRRQRAEDLMTWQIKQFEQQLLAHRRSDRSS
jgi:hypothetical protein